MEQRPVTINDVARAAEVSVATVSRVLSGGSASAAARERVVAAAREMGYRRQVPERKGESAPARALALVISDLTNPYYSMLCAGAEQAAREAGRPLIVYQPEVGRRGEDTMADAILELNACGAVLVGVPVETGTAEEIRRRLLKISQRMPIVTIGPRVEGVSCVNITSDLSVSVRKSIAHLVALGHRRIAFVGGMGGMRSSSARRRAYFEEMERLGLPIDRQVSTESAHPPQGGELWLRQLQRMGIRVPEDVALIGCDNQFFTPYLNPPLTTVDLHPFDHGVSAIGELIGALDGGSQASYSQIRECSLIVRESCGALLGVRSMREGV